MKRRYELILSASVHGRQPARGLAFGPRSQCRSRGGADPMQMRMWMCDAGGLCPQLIPVRAQV